MQLIKTNSLFSKLLIRFILISLIIISILGFSLIYFFKSFYFSQKENEIINNSRITIKYMSESLRKNDTESLKNWLKITADLNSGQAWLVNRQGRLLLSYPLQSETESIENLKQYEDIFEGQIISSRVDSSYFEKPMLLIGMPLTNNSPPDYALLFFIPVAGINSTVNQVIKIMFFSSIIAIILALIVAYRWSRSLSRPLHQMSQMAEEMSGGNFGKTIPLSGDDEIGKLATSINNMSQTLDKTINHLTEEKNKLSYIMSGMEEGVLAVSIEKEIILINKPARNLLTGNKKATGKQLEKLIQNEDIIDIFKTVLKEEKIIRHELSLNKKRVIIHCSPIYVREDQLWGAVALIQDISERWRFEQLQKDFVANVSHELKAPVSSIKGAGEILSDNILKDPEKQQEYLDIIIAESNRLEKLVNDILNLSELDSLTDGKTEKIDLTGLATSVENLFIKTNNIDKSRIKTILPEKSIYVESNENWLKQAMVNLLDNALKFSPAETPIEMGIEIIEDKAKFWVKDEGIGIPKSEQKNIWERFYKVDKARVRDSEGSGLGLAIVKQIVEDSGGQVFVKSNPEQGTTLGFSLPTI